VVIAFAALSGPLPKLGVVALAALAAGALLIRVPRGRALATLGALVLAPILLLADIWHSPQLGVVHRHPLIAVVGAIVALLALGVAAWAISRQFSVVGPLAILALPFRVPIESGGTTNNLLVPLYLVVAAGALAWLVPLLWRGERAREESTVPDRRSPEASADGSAGWALWVERLLALYIVLYALQAIYSPSFEKALQNMVFFYVPFALLYGLLRSVNWTPRMLRGCLLLVVGLALVFSVIAYAEYATKTIILNPKLVVTNDLHTYFTVNSVFFDPDIFGRFLALVMILISVLLLYPRPGREQLGVGGALIALWVALLLTLSRSSLAALLVGLAVLAALRWKPSRALVVAVVVIAVGALVVVATPRTFGLNQGVNGASSGRGGLVGGGVSLFSERPVWGYGSGSFSQEYRNHHRATASSLSASHTIPVTVAAEQGVIGELAYLALVVAAVICLVRRTRGDPVRGAMAAAFLALLFHTLLYADFLEDPITWALLSIGVSLAVAAPERSAEQSAVFALRLRPSLAQS
jgi:O-antigen ligase